MTPPLVGVAVSGRRELGPVAQRGQNQCRRAHQPKEVHPGDHEHELDVAAAIPFDACFKDAERAARAPIDFAPEAPAVVAIGELARGLVRG